MDATAPTLDELLSIDAVKKLADVIGDREDATVAVQDIDGTMRWASPPGATGMFKRELQQFAGINAADFIHDSDRERYLRAVERARDGETVNERLLASAGDESWVRVRTVVWRVDDREGRPLLLSVTTPAPDDA